ncbi:uncharacterized protein CANTADRAFT_56733 [Suhomyces tanzawaensis NRRL Y-17324]|uniref:Trafficking protein particle complex subunit 11 domain-containing protein n=1 Tax=Suhomyces tanzawaensis NRRL Y-17324 TaxID=984487 RepID=A0A1E4SC99_9ASCO|nr:uncharacterized protein CANTADRAFT_56733 [Suhomyces tanzawaensis NRRL Y-17324]ODV77140.1 hypothetical protein CANTADRAFT_56733 [Suhomyces tanzawaensis NRRL Y-17324]
MEHYPKVLIQQLAPFVKLEVAKSLESSPVAECFSKNIAQFNISGKVWDNSIIKNRLLNVRYVVEVVKESQNAHSLPVKTVSQEEHSVLSPFNVDSDLFPNGILSPKWFLKYAQDLPFAFIKTMLLSQDPAEDDDLVKQINSLKMYYNSQNVKFVVILVSQSEDADVDLRVDHLRNATNLPRLTGLLHLHNTDETLARDSELVITTLFANLKSAAVDFYSNIEYKINQRNKKYYTCPSTQGIDSDIEITPKALETRNLIKQAMINQLTNPRNLEQALKLLELSYQNLVELLRDDFANKIQQFTKVSAHDLNLFYQYRQLCDIIAFHIVRGYFSLEDPITALKKHKTHIANILSIVWVEGNASLQNYSDNWVAIQYEWLAQLMLLVPPSVLKDLQILTKRSSKAQSLPYYGGLKILGKYSFDIITSPTLGFLKSVYFLKKVKQTEPGQYAYLFEDMTSKEIKMRIINLLEKSVNATVLLPLAISDDQIESLSFLLYINWLVAEEFYLLSDDDSIKKAVEFYESSLANSAIEKWAGVSSVILQKLIMCYDKLKDLKNELINILKLAKVSDKGHLAMVSKNEKLLDNEDIHNTSLDDDAKSLGNLIDCHALVLSKDNSEAYMFDKCQVQLTLKNNLNVDLVEKFLPTGSRAKLVVEQLDLSIARLDGKQTSKRTVTLKHEVTDQLSFYSELDLQSSDIHHYIGKANLELDSNSGISRLIQFDQVFQKTGLYEIQSLKTQLKLVITLNNKTYDLTKLEVIDLDTNPFSVSTHHNTLYTPIPGREANKLEDLAKKWFRITTTNSRRIKVSPLRPDLEASIDGEIPSNLFLGEKVIIPVRIKYKSPQNQLVKYKKLSVLLSAKISWEKNDLDVDVTTQISWNGLKDDEALDLQGSVTDSRHEAVYSLNVSLLSPPNGDFEHAKAKLLLNFRTIVSEETGEVEEEEDESIYDANTYEIPILAKPFQASCVICPRCRTDGLDMPSPFLISEALEDATIMPVATRLWLVEYTLKALNQSDLLIVGSEINVKAKNPEVVVEAIQDSESLGTVSSQLVTTRSKTGFTHRNASVSASISVKWKRNGSELVNTYTSEEVEIVLPLSDPRVLVNIDAEDKGKAKIQYILENPTSRIFMFTTQLDEGEGWSFEDDRNLLPLKQPAFPVLPFTQHIMEYYWQYENEQWVKVPNLRVFDVQYKVGLPLLSVSESIVMRENRLFWKSTGV